MRHASPWLLLVAAWCFCSSLLFSSTAFAQSTAEQFAEAVDMFVAGKCDQALPILRKVYESSESPNARLYIARCLEKTGDLPGAYNEMKGTVADASARASSEPKYARTRDAAAAELAQLEPRVGRLVVAIADSPEGATARANGRVVPLGEPVAVEPGLVTVIVRAPGKAEETREVEVGKGQTKTVALTLRDEGEVTPEPEPDPGSSGPGFFTPVRIAGLTIAVVGVAGVVVFAVTASQAKSEFDDLVAQCNDTHCPDSEAERVADGRRLTTVANVSLAVGSVALLVGTAMLIFGGADDEDASDEDVSETAGIELTPVVGPGFVGLSGAF